MVDVNTAVRVLPNTVVVIVVVLHTAHISFLAPDRSCFHAYYLVFVVKVFIMVVEYVVQILEQLGAPCSNGCPKPRARSAPRRGIARSIVK